MKKGIIALSPLVVFILFYLVTSIIAGDFYKIPITVAFMVSSFYAIIIASGSSLMQRINILNELQTLLKQLVCHSLETFWSFSTNSIDSLLHLAQGRHRAPRRHGRWCLQASRWVP